MNTGKWRKTGVRFQSLMAGLGIMLVGWSGSGEAVNPLHLDAEASCVPGEGYVIDYTASSSFGNDQIDILFNNVKVDMGSFESPDYMFSGQMPAPADAGPGDSVSVSAVAQGSWSNNCDGGMTSIMVKMPEESCEEPIMNGRFTGGGHQLRVDGVRVTRGLTLHCDLLLSNNLEVNWQGNQFHMPNDGHMTTVECSDDPDIIQAPPPAPLDTMIGVGQGRYNGMDGYTVEFTVRDFGEPGRNDEMGLYIYETANPGNVVLDVPVQKLDGGNLQAHYDQPHK